MLWKKVLFYKEGIILKNKSGDVILSIAAFLIRLIPNIWFSPMGAYSIFIGKNRSVKNSIFLVTAVYVLSNVILHFSLGYPLFASIYAVVLLSLFINVYIGKKILSQSSSFNNILLSVVLSMLQFFLITNFAVWVESGMYEHNFAGLITCYSMAIPFALKDILSTTCCLIIIEKVIAPRLYGKEEMELNKESMKS